MPTVAAGSMGVWLFLAWGGLAAGHAEGAAAGSSTRLLSTQPCVPYTFPHYALTLLLSVALYSVAFTDGATPRR